MNKLTDRSPSSKIILLLILICGIAGCDQKNRSPTAPTPASLPLAVSAVNPKSGLNSSGVQISGTGFSTGATVTLGAAATDVRVLSSTLIAATAPAVAAGTVDVVVTDTNGRTAILAGGFTFEIVTLTASSTLVTPGDELKVVWAAPSGRPSLDWVGLFRTDGGNTGHEVWWRYTNGDSSGEWPVTAPAVPGQYESRYLLDDSYLAVARSASVTVR